MVFPQVPSSLYVYLGWASCSGCQLISLQHTGQRNGDASSSQRQQILAAQPEILVFCHYTQADSPKLNADFNLTCTSLHSLLCEQDAFPISSSPGTQVFTYVSLCRRHICKYFQQIARQLLFLVIPLRICSNAELLKIYISVTQSESLQRLWAHIAQPMLYVHYYVHCLKGLKLVNS